MSFKSEESVYGSGKSHFIREFPNFPLFQNSLQFLFMHLLPRGFLVCELPHARCSGGKNILGKRKRLEKTVPVSRTLENVLETFSLGQNIDFPPDLFFCLFVFAQNTSFQLGWDEEVLSSLEPSCEGAMVTCSSLHPQQRASVCRCKERASLARVHLTPPPRKSVQDRAGLAGSESWRGCPGGGGIFAKHLTLLGLFRDYRRAQPRIQHRASTRLLQGALLGLV